MKWDPEPFGADGSYSLIPMLVGSICSSILAVIIATPIALCTAVGVFAAKLNFIKTIVHLLAGIPSVVFGLWGLNTIVPLVNSIHPPGASLISGALVLSIMIAPVIILTTLSALEALPEELYNAGAALGINTLKIVFKILIPAASQSIISGIILALARAFGETMALLMVCGNIAQLPKSIFDPVLTLTTVIALEMGYSYGNHTQALYIAGTALLSIVLVMIIFTRKVLKP